ncbi:MAG: AzlC family ABC transporter permease [Desulfobacteraceae bacterium]|nr:AzlC family ABC transporter permease [Desulfobacteraceae bacterium]
MSELIENTPKTTGERVGVSDDTATTRASAFWEGVRGISPILLGVFPFALIAGVAQVNAGLEPFTAVAMSVIIFAGAAQLATADLLGKDAPFLIICMTALIINLRFVMYSASLSPHFSGIGRFWKWLSAYLLTDQAYAVSIIRFSRRHISGGKLWFYLGCAIPLWVLWQVGTVIGVVVGLKIPESWSLEFAVPLTFMAIMLPNLRDWAAVAAALTSGIIAVAAFNLPMNVSIIVAAVSGILVGFGLESFLERKAHD